MNIPKILNLNIAAPFRGGISSSQDCYTPYFGLKMSCPVNQDTISFTSKVSKTSKIVKNVAAKAETNKNASKKDEIRKDLADRIHERILKPQKRVHKLIHEILDNLVVSERFPNNPIKYIKDRPKSAASIRLKTGSTGFRSEEEIMKNMTDLNGAKIVLNEGIGQNDVNVILDQFMPYLNSRKLELIEIDVKRPIAIRDLPEKDQAKFDYIALEKLIDMKAKQEYIWNNKNYTHIRKEVDFNPEELTYTKGNYCAVHFLFRLPATPSHEASVFELQLMGPKMGEGKNLDDIIWKTLDNKEVDNKYYKIVETINRLKEDNNAPALERFKKYRLDALFDLRKQELALVHNKKRNKNLLKTSRDLFISEGKYCLTPEYSLNTLYKCMLNIN